MELNNDKENTSEESLYTESYEKPIDSGSMMEVENPFAYLHKDETYLKQDMEYDRERANFISKKKTADGFNVASVVIGGVAAIVFLSTMCVSFTVIITFIANIVGIIFAIIGLARHGNKATGIIGLCINIIVLVLSIVVGFMEFFLLWVLFA